MKKSLIVAVLSVSLLFVSVQSPLTGGMREKRDYRAAVGLLREGDLELARGQYERFLSQYPDSDKRPRALFGLAETYYLEEKYEQAAVKYRQSLEKDLEGDYRGQAFERGLESARRGNRVELAKDLIELAGEDPLEEVSRQGLLEAVLLFEEKGRYESGLELIEQVLDKHPEDKEWLHEKAVYLAEIGRLDEGLELTDEIIAADREYVPEARLLRAEINYALGERDASAEDYRSLKEAENFRYEAYYGLAWLKVEEAELEQAVKKFKKVHDQAERPELQVRAARDVARVRAELGEQAEAEGWYDTALELAREPQRSNILIEKAEYLVENDQLEEAVDYYEEAQVTLPAESVKSLIEGYISLRRYESAAERLEEALEDGRISGFRWQRLLAHSYFKLRDLERAEVTIPAPAEAPDEEEKVDAFRLLGSIFYQQGKLSEARRIFETWGDEFPGSEPELNRALVEEKLGQRSQALERLKSIVDEQPADEIEARARYHLARIIFKEDAEQAGKELDKIDTTVLEPPVSVEYELLKLASQLETEGAQAEVYERARALKDSIEREVFLSRWYGKLVEAEVPRQWWEETLVTVLLDHRLVREDWGSTTVHHLRQRGWSDFSRQVGEKILETDLKPVAAQQVRLALLETYFEAGNYEGVEEYFPSVQHLREWSSENVRGLVHFTAQYYRALEEPTSGYARLVEIQETLPEVSQEDEWFIDENIAYFALHLGQSGQAREILAAIPAESRTRTGELNLAIAEHHSGASGQAYERLISLREWFEQPPLLFYDYGFRLLRYHEDFHRLRDWSEEFMGEDRFADEKSSEPLVENIQFWASQDAETEAIEYAERLIERSEKRSFLARLKYYQGVAYYNRGDLEKAGEVLSLLREESEPVEELLARTLRIEVELALRLDDWTGAYERWQDLHELEAGGEPGARILGEAGLQAAPDRFETLLEVMESDYADYLAPGDAIFWEARLAEERGVDGAAIEAYEKYLAGGYENYDLQSQRRLAEIYAENEDFEEALHHWSEIYEATGEPEVLVEKAFIKREMDSYHESSELFLAAREEQPEREQWFDYQLGRNKVETDSPAVGLEAIETAISEAPSDAEWLTEAKGDGLRLALNHGETGVAENLIEMLGETPEKLLYRAELTRQLGDEATALQELQAFEGEFSAAQEGLEEEHREIGASIYWENENYEQLIEHLSEIPGRPRHQLWRLQSLLALEKEDSATSLYQGMDSEVVAEAAEQLGDYYFERGDWRYARGYYEEADETPRVLIRLVEVEMEQKNYERALDRLAAVLEKPADELAEDEWMPVVLNRLEGIVEKGEIPEAGLQKITAHPELFEQLDEAAPLALSWALEAEQVEKVKEYYEWLSAEQLEEQLYRELAEFLNKHEKWELLEEISGVHADLDEEIPAARAYYRLVPQVRGSDDPDTEVVEKLNQELDEAVDAASPYGPRLQVLIGDFYFRRGDYQQAAVEYHKVGLLFDEPPNRAPARLKLGEAQLRLGNEERAREILVELSEDDQVEAEISGEAVELLNEL